MIIWVDAQLPPTLAAWLVKTFGVAAFSLKELGLRDAKLLITIQLVDATQRRSRLV